MILPRRCIDPLSVPPKVNRHKTVSLGSGVFNGHLVTSAIMNAYRIPSASMRVCGLLANRVLTGEQFGHPFGRLRVGLRQQMGIPVKHRPRASPSLAATTWTGIPFTSMSVAAVCLSVCSEPAGYPPWRERGRTGS